MRRVRPVIAVAVAVTLTLLVSACSSGSGTATSASSDTEAGTTNIEAEATGRVLDGSATVIHDRCSFSPSSAWEDVSTTSAFKKYSVDPDNPVSEVPDRDQPGVFLNVSCLDNEGLGGRLPYDLPGSTTTEDDDVTFGGADGSRYVLQADDPRFPPVFQTIYWTVDVGATRCGAKVTGAVESVERFRNEVQAAMDTLVCVDR